MESTPPFPAYFSYSGPANNHTLMALCAWHYVFERFVNYGEITDFKEMHISEWAAWFNNLQFNCLGKREGYLSALEKCGEDTFEHQKETTKHALNINYPAYCTLVEQAKSMTISKVFVGKEKEDIIAWLKYKLNVGIGDEDDSCSNDPEVFYTDLKRKLDAYPMSWIDTDPIAHEFAIGSASYVNSKIGRVPRNLIRELARIAKIPTQQINQYTFIDLVAEAQNKTLAANKEKALRSIKPKKRKRGRPKDTDRKADTDLVNKWKTAKAAGVRKKDFCDDEGVSAYDLDCAMGRLRHPPKTMRKK